MLEREENLITSFHWVVVRATGGEGGWDGSQLEGLAWEEMKDTSSEIKEEEVNLRKLKAILKL